MSGTSNGDPPVTGDTANSRTRGQEIRQLLAEAVDLSGLVLIVGSITSVFVLGSIKDWPTLITSFLALFFVIVWVVASLGKKFFERRLTLILSILCFSLATVLTWVSVIHWYGDPWRRWNNDMLASVEDCSRDNERCIAKAFMCSYPESELSSAPILGKLNNDLRAGSYFLQDERIKAVLGKRLGIYDNFLGTGFAQPLNTKEYEDARIPEYLCPNSSQSDSNVITWELHPSDEYLDWTLEEIIEGKKTVRKIIEGKEEIIQAQPTDSRSKRDRLLLSLRGRLDLTAEEPAVVRFQQLVCSSGKVGHMEAVRVFFSHLGAVWKMKLRDAARFSGYTLDPNEKKKFFIWVYLPRHQDEVVPATWKNIVEHFRDEKNPWITAETK
jgi:hypothetical protein